ncbi:MAG TPA: hypothetical protein VFP60_15865 [Pseudolabrys sp.]|nr:hypothetical protein [Pseudolabrys sp.]
MGIDARARIPAAARGRRRRQAAQASLRPQLLLLAMLMAVALSYVGYILWPRWPDAPLSLDAPSLPIVVSGIAFNIEPAAIRMKVQRRPGVQERIDLSYLWPSLAPPDPAIRPTVGSSIDPNKRLFLTIAAGETTLPLMERVERIYPRYLVAQPVAGPPGLTFRAFRDGTPYEGEELVFESASPEHFLARCSLKGVMNAGMCLLERRIGNADLTFRFPRDWLEDWQSVANGIDRLLGRLHPQS